MAKKESSFKNMTLALFVITFVASISLAGVYNMTKGPIEQAKKAKIDKAIKKVIPDFDEIKNSEVYPENGKEPLIFHTAFKNGQDAGVAIETYTDQGFSGRIKIMAGFLPDGSLSNIEVLEHKETPGLGTKMTDARFKDQFKTINIGNLPGAALKVKKDGGNVDAITAATISSRAFCDAVNRAYHTLMKGEQR